MKKSTLISIFAVGTLACIGFRLYQAIFMIDPQTGFFYKQYENSPIGIYIIVSIFVLALLLLGMIFAKTKTDIAAESVPMGIFTVLFAFVALTMCVELLLKMQLEWKNIVLMVLTLIFAVYMLYFGYCRLSGSKPSSWLCVIPVLFAGFRLAAVFLGYFGLAKTNEIVIETVMLIIAMLFWHYFGKYNAGVRTESASRWLVGFALAGALICFATTIPGYYIQLFMRDTQVRAAAEQSYFDLASGVYMLVVACCVMRGKKES